MNCLSTIFFIVLVLDVVCSIALFTIALITQDFTPIMRTVDHTMIACSLGS